MAADSKSKAMDPKPDASKDPSAGLMDMMKKMYEEGDDEMKRTIAKAWTEGQDKKVRSQVFLAVQDSSIGDIVSESVSH